MLYLKYITMYAACLGMISIGLFIDNFEIIGLFGVIIFVLLSAQIIKNNKIINLPAWNYFWSIIFIILSIIITHSGVYFIYKSTTITILGTFVFLSLILLLVQKNKKIIWEVFRIKEKNNIWDILLVLLLVAELVMFLKIREKSTTDALGSPWPLFGPRFFILYFISTATLLYYNLKTKTKHLWFIPTTGFFFITFNIITLIYPLGYGYDPFLHRATEKFIYLFGAADPKTPFYIGQYVIVNILSHLSSLSIKTIDIFLVPILTSILLPISVYFGTKYGLGLKEKIARFSTLLVLLYPLKTFFVTTPHNLANLFTLVSIFLSLLILQDKKYWPLPLTFSILAIATHPLTGIFSLLLIILLLITKYKPNKTIRKSGLSGYPNLNVFIIPTIIVTSLIIPIFFVIYQTIGGVEIQLGFAGLTNFFNLFKEPYYFINRPAHFIYDFIYFYRIMLPGLIISFALLVFLFKKQKEFIIYPLMSTLVLVNIFVLSTFLKFSDLNSFEQVQYSQRLLHSSLFFILPLMILGVIKSTEYLKQYNNIIKKQYNNITIYQCSNVAILILISIFISISLYLTYPQRNPIVHFPAYNVTASDYKAAEIINNTDGNYVVLSNILTAATSIENYGYKTYFNTSEGQLFYYSIPSGSPLAELYQKMLYEGQKREYMEEAMELTDTNTAYFVLNSYWHNANQIAENAKKTADSWQEVDGGKIWIFEYYRK